MDRPPFANHLHYPWYVIIMGWPRWGSEARVKWAKELREACCKTINEIDYWLTQSDDQPQPQPQHEGQRSR